MIRILACRYYLIRLQAKSYNFTKILNTHFVLNLRAKAGDLAHPLDDGDWPRPGHNALEADLLTQHHRGLGGEDGDGQGREHQVQLDGGVAGQGEVGVARLAGDHLVPQRPVDGGQHQPVPGNLSIAKRRIS